MKVVKIGHTVKGVNKETVPVQRPPRSSHVGLFIYVEVHGILIYYAIGISLQVSKTFLIFSLAFAFAFAFA